MYAGEQEGVQDVRNCWDSGGKALGGLSFPVKGLSALGGGLRKWTHT